MLKQVITVIDWNTPQSHIHSWEVSL